MIDGFHFPVVFQIVFHFLTILFGCFLGEIKLKIVHDVLFYHKGFCPCGNILSGFAFFGIVPDCLSFHPSLACNISSQGGIGVFSFQHGGIGKRGDQNRRVFLDARLLYRCQQFPKFGIYLFELFFKRGHIVFDAIIFPCHHFNVIAVPGHKRRNVARLDCRDDIVRRRIKRKDAFVLQIRIVHLIFFEHKITVSRGKNALSVNGSISHCPSACECSISSLAFERLKHGFAVHVEIILY